MRILDYDSAPFEVKMRLVRVSKLPFKNSIYTLLNDAKTNKRTHQLYAPDCLYAKDFSSGAGIRKCLYIDKTKNDNFLAKKEKTRFEMLDLVSRLHEIYGARQKVVNALFENGVVNTKENAWMYLKAGNFYIEDRNEFIKKYAKERFGL